ncbi:hypothetical protein B0E53_04072 [Micromonospora sp. MH33]|uniref:hypothetical protein n=1 Tax=Micromonospora sp. MH33 TaxID=1945509 RepID=UPI000D148BF4|nr:hypothetical protein [Micromonospora sp. MH33]PSK63989.1 hypothetical protein B0E53_04072 [Micromonospora sp. MH33]
MTGDPDDPVTRGETFSFSTATGMTAQLYGSPFDARVEAVDPATGANFYLVLAPDGGPLEPRTYTGATAWPYYEGGPGMVLNSNLGGCDGDLVGSFTIQDIRFGPYNYLEKLDATFEQHCSGGAPAARGEVHLTNPPALPPLDPQATVAGTGAVVMPDGLVTVRGTLTCSQAALVFVDAHVQQNGRLVGLDRAEVRCLAGQAVPWTATRTEPSGVRLRPGDADVRLEISGRDPFYDVYVRVVPPLFPVRLDAA